MLSELKVSEFLEKTASSEPVPGGGSMAAMSAAAAASLVEMVAGLTIGKKGYKAVQAEMKALIEKAHPLREKLIADIDNDSEAYTRVLSAFKLPQKTDEEKQKRQAAIQAGLKHAAIVPMGVAGDAFRLLELARMAVAHGNRNAVTDGAVAALMARTAVLSALYNVKINLNAIADNAFVNELEEKVKRLEKKTIKKEQEILSLLK